MNNEGWIDITEYAVKYRVSQSTLRRRIRSNTIAYRMDRGKYLLLDSAEALNKAPLFSRQSLVKQSTPLKTMAAASPSWNRGPSGMNAETHDSAQNHSAFVASQNTAASAEDLRRLQAENKVLREQLAEAETLVKVLEAELASYNA